MAKAKSKAVVSNTDTEARRDIISAYVAPIRAMEGTTVTVFVDELVYKMLSIYLPMMGGQDLVLNERNELVLNDALLDLVHRMTGLVR